nr:phosphotransferase [Chloroflexota bacterium]
MTSSALDPAAVLAALSVTGATVVGPVGGGRDTAIWRVAAGGHHYALRVFRPEQAAGCRREIAAIQAAADAGLPVPRVHAEGVWQDRPAMLMAWLPGRSLFDELAAHPWRVWSLALAFGRMQARIHLVAAPPRLAAAPDGWLDWLGPEAPALRQRLRELAVPDPKLLHIDYHPLNVLTDGRRITGIVDWTNAGAGDPRADYARTEAILRLVPAMMPAQSTARAAIDRLGLSLLTRGWRRGYAQMAGPLDDMPAFQAWAGVMTARDMAPRPGRDGLAPAALADLRRWAADQARQAGVRVE